MGEAGQPLLLASYLSGLLTSSWLSQLATSPFLRAHSEDLAFSTRPRSCLRSTDLRRRYKPECRPSDRTVTSTWSFTDMLTARFGYFET